MASLGAGIVVDSAADRRGCRAQARRSTRIAGACAAVRRVGDELRHPGGGERRFRMAPRMNDVAQSRGPVRP